MAAQTMANSNVTGEIGRDDTVRIAGAYGLHVVDYINTHTGMIHVSRTTGNARRGGLRTVNFPAHPNRVTLVRHGNRDGDALQAFLAELDAQDAERAAIEAAKAKAEADRMAAEAAELAEFRAATAGMDGVEMLDYLIANVGA